APCRAAPLILIHSNANPIGTLCACSLRDAVAGNQRGRSHGIRHFKLDVRRSGRPTALGEAPASGLAAVTLNRTRHLPCATVDRHSSLGQRWSPAVPMFASKWSGRVKTCALLSALLVLA